MPRARRPQRLWDRLSWVGVLAGFLVIFVTFAFMFALGLGLVRVPVGH